MDISAIHPIYFFNNEALRTESIGAPEVSCVIQQIQHKNTVNNDAKVGPYSMEQILRDFIANNVCQLSTTFMIKLLEDFINKDEIAYIVDFNSDFDIKEYLLNNLKEINIHSMDNVTIINIIRSNIIFVLNQFIQFYCMYKLIYNEGVNLYEFLYKETYSEEAPKDKKQQHKYVFCTSIMNNMMEALLPDINKCCTELESTIANIKSLY